ncbi:MAG: histidine kinase [Lawsonibacter sp.]|nr:histidine kinase [Lawsonibacter sp.]
MIQDNLPIYLLTNAGLLLVAATVLTEMRPLRAILKRQDRSIPNQLVLGLVFGLLSIASTYTGLSFQGAIVNTRTISTLAAGLMCGPLTGVSAGMISGLHRYFYNLGGFTSLACGLGTASFGILGAVCYRWFSRLSVRRPLALVGLTVAAELIQCVIILAVARPFADAAALEKAILIPKIAVNSLGLVVFSAVMDRMNRSLLLEQLEAQRQVELRQQAELRALQSQINPHFLFNALNTISALCLADPNRARETILVLANYFRQTLSINEPFVTLQQELSNVDNYLFLTEARFEDAIHVVKELPDDLTRLRLPPLILQPIVENAVRHGFVAVDDRRVCIQIRQDEERAYIQVSDQGRGFPPEVLAKLQDPDDPTYSGLFNVRKRLRSIYGEQCPFAIDSTSSGSTVAFSIPLSPPAQAESDLPRRSALCASR